MWGHDLIAVTTLRSKHYIRMVNGDMALVAEQTSALLEERLARLEFLVHGAARQNGPTAGHMKEDNIANRVKALEKQFGEALQSSKPAMDLVELRECSQDAGSVGCALLMLFHQEPVCPNSPD